MKKGDHAITQRLLMYKIRGKMGCRKGETKGGKGINWSEKNAMV
jgi:hypothetical protein